MWERLSEGFLVLVVGMGGVMISLLFFYFVIAFINKADAWFVNYQKEKAEKERLRNLPPQTQIANAESEMEDDEELLAVITAAAESMLSGRVLVKSLRFLRSSSSTTWATIGRMNLISSHDVQKH